MKIFCHYTVWDKETHVPWLMEGIRDCLPKGTHVDFVFDNCTDKSHLVFDEFRVNILTGYTVRSYDSKKKYRWPNTNDAIDRFMNSDCDVFLSPQDDQKIQDKHIFKNIETILKEDNLGLVGMRDGVIDGVNFFSSSFSRGYHYTTWLKSGDYREVDYINDGPILLTKRTVREVGKFDTEYIAHFADNDYSHRIKAAGLRVFVMGCEIVHEKWGRLTASEVWSADVSTHDNNLYNSKWRS